MKNELYNDILIEDCGIFVKGNFHTFSSFVTIEKVSNIINEERSLFGSLYKKVGFDFKIILNNKRYIDLSQTIMCGKYICEDKKILFFNFEYNKLNPEYQLFFDENKKYIEKCRDKAILLHDQIIEKYIQWDKTHRIIDGVKCLIEK